MKMLEVVLDNRIGGIAVRSLLVAGRLKDQGVQVMFLTPDEPGELAGRAKEKGLSAFQIFMPRPSLRISQFLRVLKWLFTIPLVTRRISKLCQEQAVDCMHVNGLVNIPTLLAAKLNGKRVVWHFCGTDYPQCLVKLLMPLIIGSSEIVCISPAVRRYFLGDRPPLPNEHVIFEPVDTEELVRRADVASIDLVKEFNLLEGAKTCVSVGNVTSRKGFHHLVEAIILLKSRGVDVNLVVVGGKLAEHLDYWNEIEQMVSRGEVGDRVRLIGSRKDVPEILSACDIFSLASRSEGTPLVIMEAMVVGLPVVATRVGGVGDMIEDQSTGILVDYGSPEQIADGIQTLACDEERHRKIAQNGKESALKKFSLDTHLREFSKVIERAAQ